LKRLNLSSYFFTTGSHTILVFPYQILWQYSDAPPNEGVKYRRGYEIIAILEQSRFIS